MSKPSASRGWACAFCTVPVLAIVALTLLVFAPARRHTAASTATGTTSHTSATATPAARGRVQASYASLPLAFERNQGQTDAQVKYMARGNGYTLFLTANDAVFSLRSPSAESKTSAARRATEPRFMGLSARRQDFTAVVRMHLIGGNSLAKVSASGPLPGKSNYFIGNDPSKWQTDVPHYARVSYQDVYPGINLAFHGAQRQTEFDFVVAPEANPAPIGFRFTGARGIKTDDSGNLLISSAAGNVLLHKPVAYQEQNGARQPVDARFVLKANNQVSFELGKYDRSRELVIDPSVAYEYSTYLGGSGNDEGYSIAFDSNGDAYVTGQTASQNFPGTSGGFTGTAQVFVTKIATGGLSLIYSTYIGGNGNPGDSGNAIVVDQTSGAAYVAGGTTSTNFPVSPNPGAYQTTLNGSGNAFVLELSSSGTLMYSTYLGGTGNDKALGIALDASGYVYAVGSTSSTNFPTLNPVQSYLTGSTGSGFLTKLNQTGTALVYSTYIGGSSAGIGDLAEGVALDSSDDAYVTGQTFSATFHTTTGAFQTTCSGCANGKAFVTVINPNGNGYVYSTFLGGNGIDSGSGVTVDSAGDAYVTGTTTSTNFPTTTGALQTSYGGGSSDAFVTKLNPAGSAPVYSTYLGGAGDNLGVSIAVDGGNNAYVTGTTNSATFPTVNPTQLHYGGGDTDAFVSEINAAGSALAFSTYLGGSGDEDTPVFGAIAVDAPGASIYVTGNTSPPEPPGTANNFPVHSAVQPTAGGNADAFVVKYAQTTFTLAATTPAAVSPGGSSTSTVTLTSYNGYSSAVTLTCSVSGGTSPLVGCSVTGTNPQTPTAGGATSTVTITTTGTSGALFRPRKIFYATWLPIAGLSLVGLGFGSARSRRKKLLGLLMIGMVMAALFLMPACGGGSSTTTGGCPGCTSPGTYTITITGTGTDGTVQSTQVSQTVN